LIKKLFSHSIIYAIGPQLPKLVGFLLLPLFTQHLTEVDFGVWGTITAYTFMLYSLRDLGLLVPLLNSYVNHPNFWRWRWTHIFNFLVCWGFVYTVLLALLLYFTIPDQAVENRTLIVVLFSIQAFFFDMLMVFGLRYLQLKEKPIYISVVSLVSGFLAVIIQYVFIVVLKQGYMGWVYGYFFTGLVSAALYLPVFIRDIHVPYFKVKGRHLIRPLKVGLPLIPHSYSSYLLNSSDRMVMDVYQVKTEEIGLYSTAYIWGNYLEILGTAVGMAVGPLYLKIFALKEDTKKLIASLTQFLQFLFLGGCFIMALWMKELFALLIQNASLQSAYPLAIIIVMSYSYRPLYWHVVNRLQYEEKTNSLWKLSFVAGALNIILNLIFIPIYGFQVAAVTTFVSMLFLGFAGFGLKEFRAVDNASHHLILHLVLILGLSCLVYVFRELFWQSKLVISLLAILLLYLKLRVHIKTLKARVL
jgi:O-antigen/teichoic acid export membrane protein